MKNNLIALLIFTIATGCAHSSNGLKATPGRKAAAYWALMKMPAIELQAAPDAFTSWDAAELFEVGNDAYDEAEWRTALAYYDRLIRKYPDSEVISAATFNAGLAAQHEADLQRSEIYFSALVERFPDGDLAPSALWNLVELREKRHVWRQVLETIALFDRYEIDKDDLFELETRSWIARTILKPTDSNINRLEGVALEYNKRLRQGGTIGRQTLARTYWTIGEVYLGRSQAVIVDPDSARLEQELEAKAEFLLQAQDSYMRTIRALDPDWATAAVYRIGFAYESFYADLVSTPAPESLERGEKNIYFEEVRNALGSVKRKAEMAYQRIIRFSKQYGVETEWVKRAEERLSRLQRLKLPPLNQQGA